MAVTGRTLRLQAGLDADLDRVLDGQARALVGAWVDAWDEVAPDLNDTLLAMLIAGDRVTRRQLQRSQRLRGVLQVIARQLDELADEAGVIITGDLGDVIDTAGAAQASVLDSQLPPGFMTPTDLDAWSRMDARQVEAIVRRSTEQVTSALRPLSPEAYDVVRRELIRGVAAGSNPRETARRMVRRAEHGFNGGLARALTISRTETLDAHRAAAKAGQEQHPDVVTGWTWVAAMSPRTCRACLGMHGRLFPVAEPGPLGHQQCRCRRVPKTPSWAELGFDGIDEPADLTPDAEAYFDSLTPAEQRGILGRDGYDAWVAGEFPREEWARRRENDGWRDSFVPARPGGDGVPPAPPAPPTPAGAGDDRPPIGPVLGTPEQQRYVKGGTPMPIPRDNQGRPRLPDEDNANHWHTYIADPTDRATALLQYFGVSEVLVKAIANDIAQGRTPNLDNNRLVNRFYDDVLAANPASGVAPDTYSRSDLVTDLLAAARWLLEQPVVELGTVFRGINLRDIDVLDDDLAAQVTAAVETTGWWFHSASPDTQVAARYATAGSGPMVVMVINDASGVRLEPVGRMSTAPEVLVSGGISDPEYTQTGTTFLVVGRWEP